MSESYIESKDRELFDKGLLRVKWGYKHPLSFVSRGKMASLFGGKKEYEEYFGVGISFSGSNISLSPLKTSYPGHYEYSFGVDFPEINIPSDPVFLRDLARSLLDIASSIEEENL